MIRCHAVLPRMQARCTAREVECLREQQRCIDAHGMRDARVFPSHACMCGERSTKQQCAKCTYTAHAMHSAKCAAVSFQRRVAAEQRARDI